MSGCLEHKPGQGDGDGNQVRVMGVKTKSGYLGQEPGQEYGVETRSGCLGQEPGQEYGDGNQIRVLGQEPGQGVWDGNQVSMSGMGQGYPDHGYPPSIALLKSWIRLWTLQWL